MSVSSAVQVTMNSSDVCLKQITVQEGDEQSTRVQAKCCSE